jgi:hypothetical protein
LLTAAETQKIDIKNDVPVRRHSSGLPIDTIVTCVLPITIDTPSNRSAMPTADRSTWTPTASFANSVFAWANNVSSGKVGNDSVGRVWNEIADSPPTQGGFYEFATQDSQTEIKLIDRTNSSSS